MAHQRARVLKVGCVIEGGPVGWHFCADGGPVMLGHNSFMGWSIDQLDLLARIAARLEGDPSDLLRLIESLGAE